MELRGFVSDVPVSCCVCSSYLLPSVLRSSETAFNGSTGRLWTFKEEEPLRDGIFFLFATHLVNFVTTVVWLHAVFQPHSGTFVKVCNHLNLQYRS